ncbi:MAG: zinc ABC transporter substrate-binding protein [Actinobacteria bacterium]|nr:zinc ABC transporter substrate-binding protein [Actinomycetota bacterium]
MTPGPSHRLLLSLLAVASLVLVGCGADGGELATPEREPEGPVGTDTTVEADAGAGADAEEDLPLVVTTTSILGDLVANVAGDQARVEVLMPAGVDPHGFQPAASDAALLRQADLVVANGLGLEENLLDTIEAAEAEGVAVLHLAEHLDPIEFGGHADEDDDHGHDEDDDHGHDEDDDHGHDENDDHGHDEDDAADDEDGHDGHDHGPLDPHVWFDPVRMADAVHVVADELAALAEGDWETRAEVYADEILEVHAEFEAGFAGLPDGSRRLVTNHDALGYLAARYDFEVIGTVVPGSSTQAEADARAFAELVETIERAGVPAIFTENIETAALAEQLASEIAGRGGPEIEVVSLYTDALGEPGSGAETYLDMLRENGRRIVDALG